MDKKTKLSLLAVTISAVPFMSSAEILSVGNSNTGLFSIGGNAELNVNYRDNKENESGITSDENEINQDGRLLIEFAGEKSLHNGHYVRFKAQPLLNTSGNTSIDDSYLEFGGKSNWAVRIGRFEAFDMFPKPQDVFVEYSGNTANNLYQDGTSYSYELTEARGRGGDGQILLSKIHGDFYLEANFLLGNRTALFNETYHGNAIDTDQSKDTIVARPVISYQFNDFNFAVAAEANLIPDAVVDVNNEDVSERYGYAAKVSWSNDEYVVHGMYTHLDAVDEKDQTLGVTGAWRDILSLGLMHSFNDYDSPGWRVGEVDVTTLYASYAFRNAMHINDFSILLGAYYSDLNTDLSDDTGEVTNEGGDAGARVRFHYVF